ncbi:ATP-binding cassette domain-containing protein [Rhizobiales bacterium]|uniref:ABC transporter ATP-binding protein n=1 Tax=Hongsoonwoonella zoysiae TaxID=2821844 RepID=UPI0015616D6B|nr:oligopeptide/dipeptide ABC transporter ATP-binding protein [Hongsoonwoonella zoysiae]NRG16274.1 ATP-binding cassette domain-containing protein [Hongsoonwoonella zoysiae]
MSEAFISIDDVYKRFSPRLSMADRIVSKLGARVETRPVRAVDGVTLNVERGQTLGLVGESGCGKSTLGRMIAGIIEPTSGSVRIDGKPVMEGGRKADTRIQTIFQDPFASLDPRMRIGDIIAEGPFAHRLVDKSGERSYVAGYLERAGLDPSFADRFPHQFSGGQRQRIAIARALAMQPDVLVCDEPVASLDVSIQAQIVNLFLKLRREMSITLIFISHDLSVVRHVSDHVAIMYLGRIVESGPTETIYTDPRHPYTKGLLESVPKLLVEDDALVHFKPIMGEIPSPLAPPAGCHFNPRCPIAIDLCRSEDPALRPLGPGHCAACHLAQ